MVKKSFADQMLKILAVNNIWFDLKVNFLYLPVVFQKQIFLK